MIKKKNHNRGVDVLLSLQHVHTPFKLLPNYFCPHSLTRKYSMMNLINVLGI